jgi:hypothetical protein
MLGENARREELSAVARERFAKALGARPLVMTLAELIEPAYRHVLLTSDSPCKSAGLS